MLITTSRRRGKLTCAVKKFLGREISGCLDNIPAISDQCFAPYSYTTCAKIRHSRVEREAKSSAMAKAPRVSRPPEDIQHTCQTHQKTKDLRSALHHASGRAVRNLKFQCLLQMGVGTSRYMCIIQLVIKQVRTIQENIWQSKTALMTER